MNRTATESYRVTFEVQVNPLNLPKTELRAECARQICSTCFGRCQKLWRQIRSISAWRSALCGLQTFNRKVNLSPDEKSRQKTATFAWGTFEWYFDARRALYELHQIPHRQEDCQREEQHHRTQRDDENGPDPFGQLIRKHPMPVVP